MLLERMMRAARLDSNLYEEVEHNNSLTSQAATVVAIVAVCQGIGAALSAVLSRDAGGGTAIAGLVGGIVSAFIGWVVWSYITYFIGTSVFKGTATPGEMLRTLGFAQSPGVLGILAFIPIVGGLAGFLAGILTLIAGIVAIRQALDFSTGKAVLTAIIGFIVVLILSLIVGAILGVGSVLTGGLR